MDVYLAQAKISKKLRELNITPSFCHWTKDNTYIFGFVNDKKYYADIEVYEDGQVLGITSDCKNIELLDISFDNLEDVIFKIVDFIKVERVESL